MCQYSQQDLIDSGIRRGKALTKGDERSRRNLTIWLLYFMCRPFFFFFFPFLFLATRQHVLLILYMLRNQTAVTKMMQGRMTKENSQLVLNTTKDLPLSSTFFIFLLSNSVFTIPLLFDFQKQNLSSWSQDTDVKHCVFLLHLCLLFPSSYSLL